jgi:hypothetical protein
MLTAGLVVLGWVAAACLVATLVARLMRAGSERERSLPTAREDRIAWVRGDSEDDAAADSEPGPREDGSARMQRARHRVSVS